MKDFVECDADPNNPRTVTREMCFNLHQSAVRFDIIGQKTGKPARWTPCLKCPVGIELSQPKQPEKEPETVSPSVYIKGICSGCNEEKSIFAKLGICQGCLKKQGSKNAKPAAKISKPINKAVPIATPAAKPEPSPKEVATPETVLVLDFSEYPEILKWLKKQSHSEMRKPDQHAIWIISNSIDVITK